MSSASSTLMPACWVAIPKPPSTESKEAIDRSGMDALTQRLFNDMFLEGSDLKVRDRLVARALSVDAKFREELFLDTIRWDVTKAKDALNANQRSGSRPPSDLSQLRA